MKEKKLEVQKKAKQLKTLQHQVDDHKRTFDEINLSAKEEIKTSNEASVLESKLAEQKRLKQHISEMRHESLILQRTVDTLKSRHHNIEKFMSEQEEQAKAKGFHNAQKTLQSTVKDVAKIDVMKGQTLQEISEMVTKITEKLKVQRDKLQPMVRFFIPSLEVHLK